MFSEYIEFALLACLNCTVHHWLQNSFTSSISNFVPIKQELPSYPSPTLGTTNQFSVFMSLSLLETMHFVLGFFV